jgi:hypothetical protein
MKKFSHYEFGEMVYRAENAQIDREILELEKSGVELSDILVNIDKNGQWCWGEPTAMQTDDMIAEMREIGCSADGMITADEYVWLNGRINPENPSEWIESGKKYEIDSEGIIR